MRYIVAQLRYVDAGMEAGCEVEALDCDSLVFCETPKDVEDAIDACDEWAVFEVVNGKPVRRAVRYDDKNVFEIV